MQLFYRTYLSSRMSNFCTTSGNGASFRRVFSTSSQVSVEFSTSRLPNNSNTFPPNVLSQACSSLPEQAAFTESTEYRVIFIHVISYYFFIESTEHTFFTRYCLHHLYMLWMIQLHAYKTNQHNILKDFWYCDWNTAYWVIIKLHVLFLCVCVNCHLFLSSWEQNFVGLLVWLMNQYCIVCIS